MIQKSTRFILLPIAVISLVVSGVAIPFWLSGDHPLLMFFLSIVGLIVLYGSLRLTPYGNIPGIWLGSYLVVAQVLGYTLDSPLLALICLNLATSLVLGVATLASAKVSASNVASAAWWFGPIALVPGVISALWHFDLHSTASRILAIVPLVLGLMSIGKQPLEYVIGMMCGAGLVLSFILLAGASAPSLLGSRLSGSEYAHMHPNSLGLFAAMLAVGWILVAPLKSVRWMVAFCLFVLVVLADSRTVLGAMFIALFVCIPGGRWKVLLLPGVYPLVELSGLLAPRNENASVLSGREQFWLQAIEIWKSSSLLEKIFGVASNPFGHVVLPDGRIFVAHNAVLSALLRSGIFGAVAVSIGLVIAIVRLTLVGRYVEGSGRSAFLGIAVLAVATSLTENVIVGGPAWWWFAAAEAISLLPSSTSRHELIRTPMLLRQGRVGVPIAQTLHSRTALRSVLHP